MDKHLQLLLQLRDKVTAPLRGIKKYSGQAAEALKASRDQLKQLQEAQDNIGSFQRLQQTLGETESKLKSARKHLRATADAFAENDTTKTSDAMLAAKQAADKLGAKFNVQQQNLRSLSAKLKEAGISTDNLAADDRQLRASIAATTASIEKQTAALEAQKKVQKRMNALKAQHGRQMERMAMLGGASAGVKHVGQRIAQTGLRPVDAFMQHEDAMMGVQRQLPGARDAQGNLTGTYRQAEKEIRQLSERLPQTTAEIADMYTAAARMEVPVQHLGMFTELASEMGSAFDAPANDVAESMGKIANNLQIPITEIRAMADTINYLDDNAISKGSDIIGFLNRVGGVAGSVKISGQDMAALGSTLLTSGETEETAGTAVKAIFTNFAAATKGTKKFQKALGEIGLTATQVQGGMAKDAVGTLLQVAQAIKSIPEKDRLGIMAELVGKEHVGKMAKLVTNTEELRRQIELANSAEAQGSMAREAAARNSALSAQLQMQKNRMFNAMAIAGEALKQPILQLLKAINPLIERFTQWMQANPALVSGILQTVVAAGALLAVLGTIGMGLAAALGPLPWGRCFWPAFFWPALR